MFFQNLVHQITVKYCPRHRIFWSAILKQFGKSLGHDQRAAAGLPGNRDGAGNTSPSVHFGLIFGVNLTADKGQTMFKSNAHTAFPI
jgi:hypothetical protein